MEEEELNQMLAQAQNNAAEFRAHLEAEAQVQEQEQQREAERAAIDYGAMVERI